MAPDIHSIYFRDIRGFVNPGMERWEPRHRCPSVSVFDGQAVAFGGECRVHRRLSALVLLLLPTVPDMRQESGCDGCSQAHTGERRNHAESIPTPLPLPIALRRRLQQSMCKSASTDHVPCEVLFHQMPVSLHALDRAWQYR